MVRVSAAEANRSFSKIFRRAAAGERIGITSRGKTLAYLVPAEPDTATVESDSARRREVLEAIFERTEKEPYLHLGEFQREWAYED